jgi:hypothetical protein
MALVEQENEPSGIDEQQVPVPRPNAGANVSSEEGNSSEDEDPRLFQVGGEIATPAFALLDGVVYEVSQNDIQISRCSVSKALVTAYRSQRSLLFLRLGPQPRFSCQIGKFSVQIGNHSHYTPSRNARENTRFQRSQFLCLGTQKGCQS